MLKRGVGLVVVTLGAGGSFFAGRAGQGKVPGWPVQAVDATGAGDAFTAGLLAALLKVEHREKNWRYLSGDILEKACRFANAVAAISTTRMGAIPSLPLRDEVLCFLSKMGF